jgi:putative drug exporter of the RND superfamily
MRATVVVGGIPGLVASIASMVVVFLAFLAAPDVFLKLFGIGLASAIFLDATIIRMVLVPAVMQLLGDRNWWIPNWLEKILPRLDVERVAFSSAEGRTG